MGARNAPTRRTVLAALSIACGGPGFASPPPQPRVAVLIELDDPDSNDAEARAKALLAPLGGMLRGRVHHLRRGFLAEVPADALEALRRSPGVRRVAVIPDARQDPAPPR